MKYTINTSINDSIEAYVQSTVPREMLKSASLKYLHKQVEKHH